MVLIKVEVFWFDGCDEYLEGLCCKLDFSVLVDGFKVINFKVIVDLMYGLVVGCVMELFGFEVVGVVEEICSECDLLFGGYLLEFLVCYFGVLIVVVKVLMVVGIFVVGLVFDGDGDCIVVVDENGWFCSI